MSSPLMPFNPAECPCYREPGLHLEVRQKIIAGGGIQLRQQCVRCGRGAGGAISRSKVDNPDGCPYYDEGLEQLKLAEWAASPKHQGQLQERQDKTAVAAQLRRERFFADYEIYLQSPLWKAKRLAVLKRDNWKCQACLMRAACQVHHLTYNHVGNEPLFDLVSVCIDCHQKLHSLDPAV